MKNGKSEKWLEIICIMRQPQYNQIWLMVQLPCPNGVTKALKDWAVVLTQACCSSQGKLQIQDIHELDVEAAAQVVGRKDAGRFAWLQSLALQLYAFCQFCWLHFHHL